MKISDSVKKWLLDGGTPSPVVERRDGELILKATSMKIEVTHVPMGHMSVTLTFCHNGQDVATWIYPSFTEGETIYVTGVNIEIPLKLVR